MLRAPWAGHRAGSWPELPFQHVIPGPAMAAESLLEMQIFRHRHPPKSEWVLTLLTLAEKPASEWASSSVEQESTEASLSLGQAS